MYYYYIGNQSLCRPNSCPVGEICFSILQIGKFICFNPFSFDGNETTVQTLFPKELTSSKRTKSTSAVSQFTAVTERKMLVFTSNVVPTVNVSVSSVPAATIAIAAATARITSFITSSLQPVTSHQSTDSLNIWSTDVNSVNDVLCSTTDQLYGNY